MELEHWKDIWQAERHQPAVDDRERLRALLAKKSGSPIAKMKRNLDLELGAILVTYGAAILYFFRAFGGRMHEVSWFMLLIGAGFVVYYLLKRKRLKEMECLTCQVKHNLEKQVQSLEKFIRIYLWGGTALIPASALFFGWIIYRKAPYTSPANPFFPSADTPMWKAFAAWTLLCAGLTILMYFLNRWYVQKLYGQHVQKLRKILDEMQGE